MDRRLKLGVPVFPRSSHAIESQTSLFAEVVMPSEQPKTDPLERIAERIATKNLRLVCKCGHPVRIGDSAIKIILSAAEKEREAITA